MQTNPKTIILAQMRYLPPNATTVTAGANMPTNQTSSPIGNPYSRPIGGICRQIKSVRFTFPYFPQLIQLAVLILVLCIFYALYITIGVVSQIAGVFQGLILDAQQQMREGSAVEKSAHAVSIGVYSILLLPFWLIQLPFSFIGSMWSFSRFGAFIFIVFLYGRGIRREIILAANH